MTNKEYTQTSNKAKIAMMITISDSIERSPEYAITESNIGPIVRRLYKLLQALERETGGAWKEEALGIAS